MAYIENTQQPALPYLPQEMWDKIMYFKEIAEHNDKVRLVGAEIKLEFLLNISKFKNSGQTWFELSHIYNEFCSKEGYLKQVILGEEERLEMLKYVKIDHEEYYNVYHAIGELQWEQGDRLEGHDNRLQNYHESDGGVWRYCATNEIIDIS